MITNLQFFPEVFLNFPPWTWIQILNWPYAATMSNDDIIVMSTLSNGDRTILLLTKIYYFLIFLLNNYICDLFYLTFNSKCTLNNKNFMVYSFII
jgi:hypothetical protein